MKLYNKKGQSLVVEYGITFFLVLALLTSISVYVRRVLQARTRDALYFMANTVKEVHPDNGYFQYEPYYANMISVRVEDSVETTQEFGALPIGAGIIQRDLGKNVRSMTNTWQAPPAFAD
jgi:hypothetical protein